MYSWIIILVIVLVIFEHIDRTPVGVELFSLSRPDETDTLMRNGPYNAEKSKEFNRLLPKVPCGWAQLEFNCIDPVDQVDMPVGAAPVCMKVVGGHSGLYGRAMGRPRVCVKN